MWYTEGLIGVQELLTTSSRYLMVCTGRIKEIILELRERRQPLDDTAKSLIRQRGNVYAAGTVIFELTPDCHN